MANGDRQSASSDVNSREDSTTGTLGKAISLLELVAIAEKPMRFTDIVEASGQPRGTVHRQLTHLVAEGLIEQSTDQTYAVGLRLLRFAARAWSGNDLRSVATSHLTALHEATGESVHLGVLHGGEVTYLDKIEGSMPFACIRRSAIRLRPIVPELARQPCRSCPIWKSGLLLQI